MYVAITRARQRLYLAHAHSRSIYGATQHNPASRFLTEMPEDTIEKTGVGSVGISGTGYEKRGDRRGGFGVGPSSEGGRVFGAGRGERRGGGAAFGAGRTARREAAQPQETFAVGDLVDHKTFGQGRVIEVTGDQLTVKFARSGDTKKLLLGYAPIVKIKQ